MKTDTTPSLPNSYPLLQANTYDLLAHYQLASFVNDLKKRMHTATITELLSNATQWDAQWFSNYE